MGIISVFLDESGKFQDQTVISFCGFSASSAKIAKFESNWQELLRRHELKSLKISEALKSHRPLSSIIPAQSPADRGKALQPFGACIGENFGFGVSVAINVDAYRRTNHEVKRRYGGADDPIYFAFLACVLRFMEYSNGSHVSLVCDDDQQTAENFLKLYRRLRNMPDESLSQLSAITFADDRVFVGCQAADMLAGLFRLQARYHFFGEDYGYKGLLEHMTMDRGPMRTQWRFGFLGEKTFARLEQIWTKHLDWELGSF